MLKEENSSKVMMGSAFKLEVDNRNQDNFTLLRGLPAYSKISITNFQVARVVDDTLAKQFHYNQSRSEMKLSRAVIRNEGVSQLTFLFISDMKWVRKFVGVEANLNLRTSSEIVQKLGGSEPTWIPR